MEKFKNLISKIGEGLTKYVLTLSNLVTFLFLAGIGTLVYVFFTISISLGLFVLGASLLYISFVLAVYVSREYPSERQINKKRK